MVFSGLFAGSPVKARVFKAPSDASWDCVFFSNSPIVGDVAERAGWQYFPLHAPITNDDLSNSLASKQVKFLGFLDSLIAGDKKSFESYTHMIYHDHKIRMQTEHVRSLLAVMEKHPSKEIFNFATPLHKDSVFSEVAAAQDQLRYAENMGPTLNFIGELLISGAATSQTSITRTGVLAYRITPEVRKIARKLYDACTAFRQPECQIFWSMLAQQHKKLIHTEPWETSSWSAPLWQAPEHAEAEWSEGANGIEEVELSSGEKILAFSDDLITTHILQWGGHTRPEFAFATSQLASGSRVFDLGAHIGTFSLSAARAMDNRGIILAVEGNPLVFRLLRDNLAASPCCLSLNAYVGSGLEVVDVEAGSRLSQGNTGATKAPIASNRENENMKHSRTRTIDELVRIFFAPDFIKLDIEGMEGLSILSSDFIKNKKPMLYFEVSDLLQRHYGTTVGQLMLELREMGYKFFANVGERNGAHDTYTQIEVSNPDSYSEFWDVLCIGAGSRV